MFMKMLYLYYRVVKVFLIVILYYLAFPCADHSAGADEDTAHVSFDFESGGLDDWVVVEGAFGKCVTDRGVFHGKPENYNKQGRYFFSTLERDDKTPDDSYTGIMESPVFTLTEPTMSLLVGGGAHKTTYVALCTLDGDEILVAHGSNAEPMRRIEWQAPGLTGEKVFLRIVDEHTGGWGHITFDDFSAEGHIDIEATRRHFGNLEFLSTRRKLRRRLSDMNFVSLRNAVEDISETYPDSYPQGSDFLAKLSELKKDSTHIKSAFSSYSQENLAKAESAIDEFYRLRREALTAHPLVTARPILFVVRNQYKRDHHNTATIFQAGEINTQSFDGGGALKTIDFDKGGTVTTLLELPGGVVRDPDVHFDGGKIVFSMRRNINDDYHIYEIFADGTGLRQLTFADGVSDIDPVYLPDNCIVFSSTREPKYCMCNKHIMANLFRMDSDGANIHQIGKSTLFEGHASLMPDGRILYDRWEYIDRNFGDAQSLWTVNPDGTNHALYWGNNTNSPGGVIDARSIRGTEQAICIFSSCHDRPWGALAISDRRLGMDLRPPVVRTWPPDAIDITGKGNWDAFMAVDPKYEDPYPLSDKFFLCTRTTGNDERTGLFLIDVFGNEVLLHEEKQGCFDPMPLGVRQRPDVIPSRRNFDNGDGTFYVVDVYNGTHMEGVGNGSVKYLRVVESPEKRSWNSYPWNGQGTLWPAMNWHDFNNKRILGTVPVEEDGSAHFSVPSDTFVYFQLLDENGMMIQTMRSGTMVQSGELTGCIGCHDNRRTAPPPAVTEMPEAVKREPSRLNGWYGTPRLFSYTREIQPVFDRSCVRCHDYGKKAGEKLNLSGDRTNTFNTSYNELWRKKIITAIGGGPSDFLQPYSWGSQASRLIEVFMAGHKGIQLDHESMDRLITWIDINAPYYPVYATAYPENLAGRSPLNDTQLERLAGLTGILFARLAGHDSNSGPQINYDRPELSPCLSIFDNSSDPKYIEALSIISEGAGMLAVQPRADMDGFSACMIDQLREGKYSMRRQTEMRNREAIRNGYRLYDKAIP